MSDEQEKAEDLQGEAEETKAEIEEVKQAAEAAHKEGDEDRAAMLEARIDELNTDLGEIKDTLKTLLERPFAPAPQPVKKAEPQADKVAAKTADPEDVDGRVTKVHSFGSRRWFGDRAYEK